MAFQVSDDLLDVEGEPGRTGKPVGIDLRDGNPSLPIVLALAKSAVLQGIWRSADPTPAEIGAGIDAIRSSGVLGEVRREIARYVETAVEALAILPETPYRDVLESLVRELGDRAY